MDSTKRLLLQNIITELLMGVDRPGMDDLVQYLATEGYFTSPASTRFHGCYEGGLAEHSLGVYNRLSMLALDMKLDQDTSAGKKPLPFDKDTFVIAALLHDLCKVGAYLGDSKPYKWNRATPKGHGSLSVERIKKFIELKPLEELMIRYHMGLYHAIEYDERAGEYHILNQNPDLPKEERYGKSLRNAWYHNPIVKVMSFADELATMEEKANEI